MARIDRGELDSTLAAMFSNIKYRGDYLFYAHMIGQCSIKIDYEMDAPAGVAYNIDHYNLYINPTLFDTYSLINRLAILKHEMLHILYDHVGRKLERIHLPWNYATDCAINQFIKDGDLPNDCINPETLGNMLGIHVPEKESSEFYYDLIKKLVQERDPQDGDPQTLDSHGTWDKSVGDKDLQSDVTKKMIEKSTNETIKGKGDVPFETSEWLQIHTRKSEVNWKRVLRGIVGNKKTSKRPTIMKNDRRFPKRSDLKGKTKDRTFNLLVVADVSGSMDDVALTTTLGEVRHICDVTKTDVDLIQIDTQAYQPEKLTKKTSLFDRKGYGGTNLYPAIEKAQECGIDFQAIVVLTDGGVLKNDIQKFNNLGKKVIWLVENGGVVLDEMNQGKMIGIQLEKSDK